MKQQIKRLWVRALRSGQYKQGKGSLLNINTQNGEECFCVLGVLTDLYQKVMEVGTWDRNNRLLDGETPFTVGTSSLDYISLPIIVRDWAGLTRFNPVLVVEGKRVTVSQLNDTGKNFDDLAKIIENSL